MVFLLDSSFLFSFFLSGYRSVLTEVYILKIFVLQPALIFKQEFIDSKKKKKKNLWLVPGAPGTHPLGLPTAPECLLSPSCLPPSLLSFLSISFSIKGTHAFVIRWKQEICLHSHPKSLPRIKQTLCQVLWSIFPCNFHRRVQILRCAGHLCSYLVIYICKAWIIATCL